MKYPEDEEEDPFLLEYYSSLTIVFNGIYEWKRKF